MVAIYESKSSCIRLESERASSNSHLDISELFADAAMSVCAKSAAISLVLNGVLPHIPSGTKRQIRAICTSTNRTVPKVLLFTLFISFSFA